jgi:hypothetical protein
MEIQVAKVNKISFEDTVKNISKKFKINVSWEYGEEKVLYRTHDDQGRKVLVKGWDVTFSVNDDDINSIENTGWNYLGSFQDEDGAIIITPSYYATSNGYELSSIKDEVEGFPCHECGRKINRVILHVFEKDGEIKVFGSGCAEKKFGINFLNVVSKFSRFIVNISELSDNNYGSFGKVKSYYTAKDWFELGYYLINKSGYVSTSKARQFGDTPTNDVLANYYRILFLIGGSMFNHEKEIQDTVPGEIKELDINLDEFIVFTEKYIENECSGDFEYNLKTALDVMKEGYVIPKLSAYMLYVVFKFWKENNKTEKQSYNEDYTDLVEGQKIKKMSVSIVDKHIFNGYYGTTNIYTMKGNDDRKYKWFTTKEFNTGDNLLISTCTVKKFEDHPTYGKSVILTRCYTKQINP